MLCSLIKQSGHATRHGGAWGERRYSSYSFLTSALDGGEWSASCTGRALPRGKDPPVPIVEEAGWALEPVWTQRLQEKSFPLSRIEPRSPGGPVRSQTLYWLSYPGSSVHYYSNKRFRKEIIYPHYLTILYQFHCLNLEVGVVLLRAKVWVKPRKATTNIPQFYNPLKPNPSHFGTDGPSVKFGVEPSSGTHDQTLIWSRRSSKYLRIQSVPQRKHYTSPLQTSGC
jgi:hypothetical protein